MICQDWNVLVRQRTDEHKRKSLWSCSFTSQTEPFQSSQTWKSQKPIPRISLTSIHHRTDRVGIIPTSPESLITAGRLIQNIKKYRKKRKKKAQSRKKKTKNCADNSVVSLQAPSDQALITLCCFSQNNKINQSNVLSFLFSFYFFIFSVFLDQRWFGCFLSLFQ